MWSDLWNALGGIGTILAGLAALLTLRTRKETRQLRVSEETRQDQHAERAALIDALLAHHAWHHSGRVPVDHSHNEGAMV